jgi:hypothetical protein
MAMVTAIVCDLVVELLRPPVRVDEPMLFDRGEQRKAQLGTMITR